MKEWKALNINVALVYDALYRMGFKADRTGFFYLSYSVYCCLCFPAFRPVTTAWLYPEVAKHYRVPLQRVQEDVSTAIRRAWRNNREKIEYIAGFPMENCPVDTEIICYLYSYIVAQQSLEL